MDAPEVRLCLECRRPMSGKESRLRHDRCSERMRRRRYRMRLYAAGLNSRQAFKDLRLQEVTG